MRSQWFRQGTPITSKDEFANLTMESMRGKITIMQARVRRIYESRPATADGALCFVHSRGDCAQNFVGAAVHPGAVLGWDSVADIQDDFELTGGCSLCAHGARATHIQHDTLQHSANVVSQRRGQPALRARSAAPARARLSRCLPAVGDRPS
jgi:hypothetical protein